ncbi:response regulator [Candidatus Nitrosotenuis sp. DW1]|uniref:response regulator n=1 Tax=Candidatus Nitrosotenuis sp. DW1 TaxID=2259672 RepID=UPI0015CB9F46|nr:response regulator [Candidatus Nitrosotenuis sp. DW1]QLH08740.1 response regulator [Candidatus Nitrosotenuis sp. DW1]
MDKTLTAIVIDDDKDVLELFSEYLKIIQVEVVGKGHNGKKAVELYQEKSPDITFVDLTMPEYDGIFALQSIREIDPKANVIIITGNLQKDVSEKLDCLNPDKILQKPFEVDKIIEAVDWIKNSK